MGDGYADADPRILMLGEANHGTTSDGADRTYTDGVVRRAFRDAAGGNGNHWIRTVRNISVMLTGNTSTRAQRGMGYRGLRRVCPTHANGSVPQPLPHATPEEIAFGRGAFLAMLDVLKPDFVPVRGLTLFKQLWLSSENGITMLDPGLCPYVLRNRPDVHIWYCPPVAGFQPCFRISERGGRPKTAYPLLPLPALFRPLHTSGCRLPDGETFAFLM